MPSDPPEVCSSSESMTSISSFRSLAAARGSECNIRVVCRFRPLNESEIQAGSSCVVKFPTNAKDTVVVSGKAFVYDRVFAPETDQHQVYLDVAQQIVDDVLNGYNGTIFAYGQTSSGKTHTMEGSLGDELNQGIVPRIINDIFNHIYSMDSNLQFHIKISYFEIYMDKIRDLLDPAKVNLAVHEDKNRVPYVKGCTERFVSCPDEVLIAMEEGKANRHIAVTNMNEHSSRSHCVFLIDVKQENMETNKKLTGKLYLVDLAGSEKVSKTGAEGTVLDEARNINRSLSALGNVIAALAEGTKSHVPYRDSKLTRILQESLGGNARTTIIICCSPSSYNECETKSTLYFGQRAKTIKNTVAINEELTADEWKLRFDKEHQKVLKLRNMFALADTELQKWRSGASMSEDSLKQFFQRSLIESNVLYDENDEDCRSGRFNNHGITDDERLQMERERSALCQRLDEKDDEIAGLEAKNAGLLNDLSEKDEELHRIENQLNELQVERTFYMQRYEKTKDEVQMALKTLEDLSMKYEARIVDLSKRLEERRQVVDQYEQRIKKLTEVEREFEVLKRKFEDLTNLSDEQHSRIQLLERTRTELESLKIGLETRNDSLANEVAELKKDSPGQCDGPSEDHLEKLKRDLADRTKTLELTRQQLCEARHFQETLGAELDQSRKACEQKSSQLDEYIKQHESQQQAKEGLRALEQTIRTELRNLHVLRQRFVEDLQSRLRTRNLADSMSSSSLFCDGSAAETASDEAKGQSSIVQRQKIEYLENNLEMLTGLHKQLVKENADLLEEVPKLETKFRETWNRLKGLEAALKEAKETAMRDRKRYQYEVNRIKEAVRMRTMTRRPNAAQIVIPVQAGRPPCPSFGGPSVQ